jgi:hypothetical protein
VTLLGNDWTAWIGDSVPASLTNDLRLFKRKVESFNSYFGENDDVVCDGAYNQLQPSIQALESLGKMHIDQPTYNNQRSPSLCRTN